MHQCLAGGLRGPEEHEASQRTPLKIRDVPDLMVSPFRFPLSAPYTSGQRSGCKFPLKSSFRMEGRGTTGTQKGPPKPRSHLPTSRRRKGIMYYGTNQPVSLWYCKQGQRPFLDAFLTRSARNHKSRVLSTSKGSLRPVRRYQ